MRTKRKLKRRSRSHVALVKSSRSRRVRSRASNARRASARRKKTALRRMSVS